MNYFPRPKPGERKTEGCFGSTKTTQHNCAFEELRRYGIKE
jgi:hypothetical protein